MVWYQLPGNVPGKYATVAASQTNKVLGNTGASGDYLETLIITAATTTPGAVTLKDGSTAVLSIPAGTATVLPYTVIIPIHAYSTTGSWNITTATNVSCMAIGQFS